MVTKASFWIFDPLSPVLHPLELQSKQVHSDCCPSRLRIASQPASLANAAAQGCRLVNTRRRLVFLLLLIINLPLSFLHHHLRLQ
jgi:hypothetical protein